MKRIVLHPFLFALLPVITLASLNKESISLRYSIRPVVVALVLAGSILALASRLLGSLSKASFVSAVWVTLLFAFGHVANLIETHLPNLSRAAILAALTMAWAIATILVARVATRSTISFGGVNRGLAILGAVSLLLPLIDLTRYEFVRRDGLAEKVTYLGPQLHSEDFTAPAIRPDIYYIILDGYGRSDTLAEIYDFNNLEFLESLQEMGFFVATQSRSNYAQTHLSLASSLNMQYLDHLADELGQDSRDHTAIDYVLGHNQVSRLLDDLGYEVIGISSGYRRTELRRADRLIFEPIDAVTPFEATLIEHSALKVPLETAPLLGAARWYPGYEAHRRLVTFQFDQLRLVEQYPGPKFVFAHIMSPHPPFVFAADGSPAQNTFPYSAFDGDLYPGRSEDYVEGYSAQLSYINNKILETVDTILENSDSPPVIILQGDHGPGSQLVWDDPSVTNMDERMSILNAIHLPGNQLKAEHDGLTPVNSFRLVFSELFNADVQPLEDRILYSSWQLPYRFYDVTELTQRSGSLASPIVGSPSPDP